MDNSNNNNVYTGPDRRKNTDKYYKWGRTVFITIAACILFFFLLLKIGEIFGFFGKVISTLSSVILGIAFAYLMNPTVIAFNSLYLKAFEKYSKSKCHKSIRSFCDKINKKIAGFFKKISNAIKNFFEKIAFLNKIVTTIKKLMVSLKKDKEPKEVKKKEKLTAEEKIAKSAKGASIASGVIMFLACITMFGFIVIPNLISTVTDLLSNLMDSYDHLTTSVETFIDTYFSANESIHSFLTSSLASLSNNLTLWISNFLLETNSLLSLASGLTSFGKGLVNAVVDFLVGLAVAVYVLSSKEKFIGQIKKIVYMSCKRTETANMIVVIARESNKIFGGFISGKIFDSIIIGIICFIGMSIFNMPFALLISVIIGITNIIPFFGPFIGAIPSAVLILLYSPITCLWFCLFIFALQQLDGNVIGPAILGASTQLSAFWVVVSILLFGGLFGFIGMLLGVPVFALIYYITKSVIEIKLVNKGMSSNTDFYSTLDHIDPETGHAYHISKALSDDEDKTDKKANKQLNSDELKEAILQVMKDRRKNKNNSESSSSVNLKKSNDLSESITADGLTNEIISSLMEDDN
ncbi:MAG: AI-2E family transporter [Lachnospiraceae bacterium]|nr:AI-2E family transporter [Lachnospiraceae bacterium]